MTQQNEKFVEPTRDEIPQISRGHVTAMESTDDDAAWVIAGAPQHPSWYLNLSDRTANPEVLVRRQGTLYWSAAEILEGDEYDRVWAALTADREHYTNYQSRTNRKLPLVRLDVTRPA